MLRTKKKYCHYFVRVADESAIMCGLGCQELNVPCNAIHSAIRAVSVIQTMRKKGIH